MIRDDFIMLTEEEKSKYKFKNCQSCGLYECELIKGVELLSKNSSNNSLPKYVEDEIVNCQMREFSKVKCDAKMISDGIGEAYKIKIFNNIIEKHNPDTWNQKHHVFISANTGKGKNYFIENYLFPYIREINYQSRTDYKILIISNRIALRSQINNRINNNYCSQDSEEELIYNYSDCAEVISYQGILNNIDKLKAKQNKVISKYLFVICDEAHFFTSDALFNPETEKILISIVNIFSDSVRIYMSATPYKCLKYINQHEKDLGIFYNFERNYNYLDIKYYSEHKELLNVIEKSVTKEKENWIIFLDNKNKCFELKNSLENFIGNDMNLEKSEKNPNLKGKVFSINADSKYDKKYKEMILKEAFTDNTKVLITTSVIDNGVNFRNVQNVVISDISKDKCLQMLGRARVEKDQKVTLYIKTINKDYITRIINKLEKQQNGYHDYDLAFDRAYDFKESSNKYSYKERFMNYYYNSDEGFSNALHWFGREKREPEKIYYNKIAKDLINNLIPEYKLILSDIENENDNLMFSGQKYLEFQLSWFGKIFNKNNFITSEYNHMNKKVLVDFLNSKINIPLNAVEQEKFKLEVTKLIDEAFSREDPNIKRNYGIVKLNKIFDTYNLPYNIESERKNDASGNKNTYWKVILNKN